MVVMMLGTNYEGMQEEMTIDDLQIIEGSIPSGLSGQYVRNGPNHEEEGNEFDDWLDGYGMMHAVTLVSDDNHDDGGKASYRNRFVDSKMKRNKGNKGGFDMHFGALFSSYRFIVVTFYNAVVMVKRRLFGQVIKG
eukprot:TRINITY_DN1098_c0_g2_i3.p2 TRINITY_DN1098_c0_g2~~TRINITY_DN1098_c0_g2_i3.p2  ORF type:complete len:136 (-),score=34.00 TRINITY_DN1098_c0_g2_i3:329-736(-)